MATIQVSDIQLKKIMNYVTEINKRTSNKFTKKSTVIRAINIFHDHLNESSLNKDYGKMSAVGVNNIAINQLKKAKDKYHKPMYVLASACIEAYFNSLMDLKGANIALVKFKKSEKVYAFYFDSQQMAIQQGDTVKVETRKYYGRHNNSKIVMLNGRVVAIGYEENAKSNHKPVIEIVRKREIGNYSMKN